MKNVTLSMPEDLLREARSYAQKRGITLNSMIRDLLKKRIRANVNKNPSDYLDRFMDDLGIDTKNYKFNREEIHER